MATIKLKLTNITWADNVTSSADLYETQMCFSFVDENTPSRTPEGAIIYDYSVNPAVPMYIPFDLYRTYIGSYPVSAEALSPILADVYDEAKRAAQKRANAEEKRISFAPVKETMTFPIDVFEGEITFQ